MILFALPEKADHDYLQDCNAEPVKQSQSTKIILIVFWALFF